ncbi:CLUMA_CG015931, isoform A [Clunio marinus]|uniref:CLUMA_CG015931, isoform A n=1 Tax=Clunio marinus TaxID=568069 RepID=A0A1J1IRU0_9DIPT|nr:CLUMA_CG015931, isoform A [Clunio marinus]
MNSLSLSPINFKSNLGHVMVGCDAYDAHKTCSVHFKEFYCLALASVNRVTTHKSCCFDFSALTSRNLVQNLS